LDIAVSLALPIIKEKADSVKGVSTESAGYSPASFSAAVFASVSGIADRVAFSYKSKKTVKNYARALLFGKY